MNEKGSEERWRKTHKVLASCVFTQKHILIQNVRDFRYPSGVEDKPEERFIDMEFTEDDVMSAWVAIIPFRPHFAHLITSFELRDGRYVAISIEIRYREGEPYILWKTFIPHYWLSYIIATEDDVFRIRTDVRSNEPLHLYKLALTKAEAGALCLDMLTRAEVVKHGKPERFNSAVNSCTSNVLTHLKKCTNKKLPWSRAHYLTDRLDPYLMKHGFITPDGSFTDGLRSIHCINDIARTIPPDAPDFSLRIRRAIGYSFIFSVNSLIQLRS